MNHLTESGENKRNAEVLFHLLNITDLSDNFDQKLDAYLNNLGKTFEDFLDVKVDLGHMKFINVYDIKTTLQRYLQLLAIEKLMHLIEKKYFPSNRLKYFLKDIVLNSFETQIGSDKYDEIVVFVTQTIINNGEGSQLNDIKINAKEYYVNSLRRSLIFKLSLDSDDYRNFVTFVKKNRYAFSSISRLSNNPEELQNEYMNLYMEYMMNVIYDFIDTIKNIGPEQQITDDKLFVLQSLKSEIYGKKIYSALFKNKDLTLTEIYKLFWVKNIAYLRLIRMMSNYIPYVEDNDLVDFPEILDDTKTDDTKTNVKTSDVKIDLISNPSQECTANNLFYLLRDTPLDSAFDEKLLEFLGSNKFENFLDHVLNIKQGLRTINKIQPTLQRSLVLLDIDKLEHLITKNYISLDTLVEIFRDVFLYAFQEQITTEKYDNIVIMFCSKLIDGGKSDAIKTMKFKSKKYFTTMIEMTLLQNVVKDPDFRKFMELSGCDEADLNDQLPDYSEERLILKYANIVDVYLNNMRSKIVRIVEAINELKPGLELSKNQEKILELFTGGIENYHKVYPTIVNDDDLSPLNVINLYWTENDTYYILEKLFKDAGCE